MAAKAGMGGERSISRRAKRGRLGFDTIGLCCLRCYNAAHDPG
jgi:hypothetical protein